MSNEKQQQIRDRARALLYKHGRSATARSNIILILVEEFGISGQSASNYIKYQKRKIWLPTQRSA